MGQTPFPRNERCPCGSGDKYKRCCFTKGFTYYVEEETGEVVRAVPLSEEARTELEGLLEKQQEKFIAKFGREHKLARGHRERDARCGHPARVVVVRGPRSAHPQDAVTVVVGGRDRRR